MRNPENDHEMLQLNPSAVELPYGTRQPKKFKIWPMSVGEQMALSETITSALSEFLETKGDDVSAPDMAGFVVDIIQKNIVKIIEIVVDDAFNPSDILGDITNDQAVNMCVKIYEMNYKAAAKNLKSLFAKLSPMFLSERQSPVSSHVPAMDIPTSSKKDIGTED